MSIKWNSIIIKLIFAFLLVILPLYMLSVGLTFHSSGQMRGEIDRSNESVLLFHYSNLQLELERMVDLISEYSIDRELSDFYTLSPVLSQYEVSKRLNDIMVKLRQMKSSSPYIQDVVYYIPGLNKRVSISGGITDIKPGEWEGMIESQGRMKGMVSEYEGELMLIKSSPLILSTSSEPNFILVIQLSPKQLREQLSSIRKGQPGGALLRFGSNHHVDVSNEQLPDDVRLLLDHELRKERPEGEVIRQITEDNHIYAVADNNSQFQLLSYIPNEVLYEPIQRYSLRMWGLTVVSCMIIVLFSIGIYRLIHRPLARLMKSFRSLERGDTQTELQHKRGDEFGYLYDQFNKTMRQLRSLIEDNYIQRIHTQESQLKHLQSQIAPHFLYNSLFTIKQMAEVEDVDGIKTFSDFLGRYFQFMTRDFAREVTLRQELDHSLVYLNIQQIRFSNRLQIRIQEPPESVMSLLVPRIILQPVLENAFEHGLKRSASGGILHLSYRLDDGMLMVIVEDNGEQLSDERLAELQSKLLYSTVFQEIEETTGLVNVHRRLRIRFGLDYGLYLSRSEAYGGLRVELRLPLHNTLKD